MNEPTMQIRAGYEIGIHCEHPAPMVCVLSVHPSQAHNIQGDAQVHTTPELPLHHFSDVYGNRCTRLVAPQGELHLRADFAITDPAPLAADPSAQEVHVEALPDEVIPYLWPSRYCESDKVAPIAWSQFGGAQRGYARVQSVLAYVQDRVRGGYEQASPTRSAWDAHQERCGVGRDRTHLALALCRALNIPARYATGFVAQTADPTLSPADFGVWLEVYLNSGWVVAEPEPTLSPTSRIAMAYGRDAADVALYTTFGPSELVAFRVYCHPEPRNCVAAD
jgi:transglutaminase-like putative cysteine protease